MRFDLRWMLAIVLAPAIPGLSVPFAPTSPPFGAVATLSLEYREDLRQAETIRRTRDLVDDVITTSYAELRDTAIQIKVFQGESDFFRTRFAVPQFMSVGGMKYILFVNPRVFELKAPEAGLKAIIAHELAHILYFKQRNRVRHFNLVRLESASFTAGFERRTDLEAISRGFGDGLKEYRQWLYEHVPARKLAEKRSNYFSPEEIDALVSMSAARPCLFGYWRKRVPRDLSEILRSASAIC
ncbi:MAG: hypothetical protein ABI882_16945 [Acidobacteriota bacterium]